LVNGQSQGDGRAAGAREESLPELEVILQHRIGYDDDMKPYVKGEDGSAGEDRGGQSAQHRCVREAIPRQPSAPPETGGGPRRGCARRRVAPLDGGPRRPRSTPRNRVSTAGDRSPQAINDLFRGQPGAKRASRRSEEYSHGFLRHEHEQVLHPEPGG
jgi:hypothetical protein